MGKIFLDQHGVLWIRLLNGHSLKYSGSHLTFRGEEFRFMISLILTIYETVKSLHTADSLHDLMPLYSHDCINSEVSPVQTGILELV